MIIQNTYHNGTLFYMMTVIEHSYYNLKKAK